MKERKIMTTKTSRQTMMQHKSENEDRLIKSIEEDDFEFNYFQSNALNFLNISRSFWFKVEKLSISMRISRESFS